jgi:prepilin-type N-terminal cleavage/methylation domain-containing protein
VASRRGFTLIELLVVVLVLAVLAALAIPRFTAARDRARDATARADLRSAFTTALTARAAGAPWPDATTLAAADGALRTTTGDATIGTLSIAVNGTTFTAAALSATGTCFRVSADTAGTPTWTQDTVSPCNANPLWTPANLPGLALWLDASDASTVTLNGGAVSEWRDKSGTNRHATQAAPAAQPSYVAGALNGRNVVRFLADGDWVDLVTLSALGNDASVTTVTRSTDPSYYVVLSAGVTTYGWTSDPAGCHQVWNAAGSPQMIHNGTTVSWTNRCVVAAAVGATPAIVVANDVAFETWTTAANFSGYSEFYPADPGWNFTGDAMELVMTSQLLSVSDRQKLEGYLAHRWGLAANLPAGHPHRSAPPTQ